MTTLHTARGTLTHAVVASSREHDGWPGEADSQINDACRQVIDAMQDEHGEAWLGRINGKGDADFPTVMWQWDGGLVYNFGAAFVAPRFDAELVRLIEARDAAPYTGTTDDAKRIDAIFARLDAIGGVHLFWT